MLDISESIDNGHSIIKLIGRIDSFTATQIEKAIHADGITSMTWDCEQLDYMSSSGLRLLLKYARIIAPHKVTIINANECVIGVLEISGFLDIVDVHKKEETLLEQVPTL